MVAFHLIGIILWMGGLVTLARLLGHHAGLDSKEAREALVGFEKKSYLFAILPGFLLALLTGLGLLVSKGDGISFYLSPDAGPWGGTFHAKLTFVVLIIVFDQLVFAKMRKLHSTDEGSRGFFMAAHGIIGLLFIAVVILVKTNLLGG